jgi:hypothetical protein
MSENELRIVTLEAMRMAGASGFGEQPEEQARTKLLAWAKDQGINQQEQRFFGFNNPNPTHGSPNCGYEQWVSVGPKEKSAEGIEIKGFPDGLSAVARFKGSLPIPPAVLCGGPLLPRRKPRPAFNEALEHGVGCDLDLVSSTLQATPQGDIGLHIAARSNLSVRDFHGDNVVKTRCHCEPAGRCNLIL